MCHRVRMDPRTRPVIVGLLAGALLLLLPEGLGPVVVIGGGLVAGWVLPGSPMSAALLFLLPSLVLGGVRIALDDDAPSSGALLFGVVTTVLFVAIFTHVGAGLALRRQRT